MTSTSPEVDRGREHHASRVHFFWSRGLTLLAVAATLDLFACASESTARPAPSPIVGTWKQTMAEERVGTGSWAAPADAACRLDNTEEFAADGAYTLYDGTLSCGPGGTGIVSGTWRLAAANTKVIFTYEGTSGEYPSTVEMLTDSDMVLTFDTGRTDGLQTRSTYRK